MINITEINPSEIMISAIVGVFVAELWRFIKKRYAKTRPVKKLKNIKAIKVLWFILAYIFPLGTIVFLIIDKNTELTFTNIALFIIICFALIFNILMYYVNSIYRDFTQLTKKNSEALNQIDNNFKSIYSTIIETKKNSNK